MLCKKCGYIKGFFNGCIDGAPLGRCDCKEDKMKLDLLALLHAIARMEGYFKPGTIPTRCHNPGDLRFAGQDGSFPSAWGEPVPFAQFDCAGRGIAANLRQLARWIQAGLTLRQLLTKWAPAADGNSEPAYLAGVLADLKEHGIELDPDTVLWDYLPLEE